MWIWESVSAWHCYFVKQLFVGFWWIRWLENHLFLLWTIHESIKYYLNEILCLNKSVKKKNVSAWHVKILHVWSHWFKTPGSLPHIFFRIPYQVVLDIQKLFWIGTKMKKIIFACHALTHGTHLSWFPPKSRSFRLLSKNVQNHEIWAYIGRDIQRILKASQNFNFKVVRFYDISFCFFFLK